MSRFCESCGNQVSENAKFCSICGSKIPQVEHFPAVNNEIEKVIEVSTTVDESIRKKELLGILIRSLIVHHENSSEHRGSFVVASSIKVKDNQSILDPTSDKKTDERRMQNSNINYSPIPPKRLRDGAGIR